MRTINNILMSLILTAAIAAPCMVLTKLGNTKAAVIAAME